MGHQLKSLHEAIKSGRRLVIQMGFDKSAIPVAQLFAGKLWDEPGVAWMSLWWPGISECQRVRVAACNLREVEGGVDGPAWFDKDKDVLIRSPYSYRGEVSDFVRWEKFKKKHHGAFDDGTDEMLRIRKTSFVLTQ